MKKLKTQENELLTGTEMPRFLFLADTHLGFDWPLRPRIQKRRRGSDFFKAFEDTLIAARNYRVNGIIHGGDLFFRSKIPSSLIEKVFEPMLMTAEDGIPIYLVPGNHERSIIPSTLFTSHPSIHIFDRPKTLIHPVGDLNIGLTGFPCIRKNIRTNFIPALTKTSWQSNDTDVRLLCVHQTFQGATIGPHNFVFENGPDVIPMKLIPKGFHAILTGHIHRHQVLASLPSAQKGSCPVIYAGSTERTSFAEKDDPKGFVLVNINKTANKGKPEIEWEFVQLDTRPMANIEIHIDGLTKPQIKKVLKGKLAKMPKDGIVKITFFSSGQAPRNILSAAEIRAIAPATMNIKTIVKNH